MIDNVVDLFWCSLDASSKYFTNQVVMVLQSSSNTSGRKSAGEMIDGMGNSLAEKKETLLMIRNLLELFEER